MQNFSQAQLAVVAYAQVAGTDGSSTLCNSGLATTRLGMGTYQLGLPVGSQNQLGLGQLTATDLVTVTPLVGSAVTTPTTPLMVMVVNNTDTNNKLVLFGSSATTAVDSSFSVIIYRSLVPGGGNLGGNGIPA
jgi:hypothetical protein